MAMQVGEEGNSTRAEMNVVPLIDILLVLLIIFMVISPTMPKGLSTEIPQPADSRIRSVPSPEIVVVQVKNDGTLRINQTEVSWSGLEARLSKIFSRRAQRVAFIRGDGGVRFAQIARAIDIMRRSGVEHVGLMITGLDAVQ